MRGSGVLLITTTHSKFGQSSLATLSSVWRSISGGSRQAGMWIETSGACSGSSARRCEQQAAWLRPEDDGGKLLDALLHDHDERDEQHGADEHGDLRPSTK